MPFYTPLRYPGGKRRLAAAVIRLITENGLKDVEYAEACAGGAALALALLFEEFASTVHINDLSRPVYAFWHAALNETAELCRRVERVKVTMREWDRQRQVYERWDTADLQDLGFASLFLNRTNRSGIIGGGVIGGKAQDGPWELDARFHKKELIRRIQRIGRYKNRIRIYQSDALEFVNDVISRLGPNSFAFFDPPYIDKGEALYLNDYQLDDHRDLCARITRLSQPWIVTYDCAAVKYGLYRSYRRIVYGLSYSTQDRYRSKEVMFLSHNLKLPPSWRPGRRFLMSSTQSQYPFYGRTERITRTARRINRSRA